MGHAKRKDKQEEAPAEGPAPVPSGTPGGWVKPAGLSRRGWLMLGACILVMQTPFIHYFLFHRAPTATRTVPFSETFDEFGVVARDFWSTGMYWRAVRGELFVPGPKNNPLWLRAELPDDVVVEFDARGETNEGDIRLELFGNGTNPSSGYVLMQGGWNNSRSVLARLDINSQSLTDLQNLASKRGGDLVSSGVFQKSTPLHVEASAPSVTPGETYHWRVERRGSLLRWFIDGRLVAELNDPFPLHGKGHTRLALSGFEMPTYFDNLRIWPAESAPPLTASAAPAPAAEQSSTPAGPFSDDFEREDLGEAWYATNPSVARLEGGSLTLSMVHNQPVWLRHPLPDNAMIEFDTWSESPDGDIKVEAWGDGHSRYTGDLRYQYTATGYVFIFGGWKNSASVIAHGNEHRPDNAIRQGHDVQPNQHYHMQIIRRGAQFQWNIDGKPWLQYTDPQPLSGPSNRFFAFSGWESRVHFDNLRVTPL